MSVFEHEEDLRLERMIRDGQVMARADRELVDALRKRREAQDLSQTEVGKRMGISQSAVARLESWPRDLRQSTIRRYALAVGAVVTHEVRPSGSVRGWSRVSIGQPVEGRGRLSVLPVAPAFAWQGNPANPLGEDADAG